MAVGGRGAVPCRSRSGPMRATEPRFCPAGGRARPCSGVAFGGLRWRARRGCRSGGPEEPFTPGGAGVQRRDAQWARGSAPGRFGGPRTSWPKTGAEGSGVGVEARRHSHVRPTATPAMATKAAAGWAGPSTSRRPGKVGWPLAPHACGRIPAGDKARPRRLAATRPRPPLVWAAGEAGRRRRWQTRCPIHDHPGRRSTASRRGGRGSASRVRHGSAAVQATPAAHEARIQPGGNQQGSEKEPRRWAGRADGNQQRRAHARTASGEHGGRAGAGAES